MIVFWVTVTAPSNNKDAPWINSSKEEINRFFTNFLQTITTDFKLSILLKVSQDYFRDPRRARDQSAQDPLFARATEKEVHQRDNAGRASCVHEELEQMSAWFSEEGLAQDSPKEAQLCVLWRAHQATRSRLICVTRDLDIQRSQHLAEMAEVRKSLEQIRVFTDQKDVLAQKIQDENDLLKDRLQGLLSIQDAQTSEVAKMLYQQGLTELIPSSPSEQVAYLLVERASLLEIIETPDKLTADRNTNSPLGTGTEMPNIYTQQSAHKGAPRHSQSPWKRLFGLHKVSQSKHIPVEVRCLTGQSSIVERERSRLERDLEEGSRRLAMAHSEIRRLTDELESAHLTQRTYEPELQAAQQEVEQLGQEVEKLKKYEMVELRKAKELNDRLDLEIRALRSRVRTLDSEKKSLQQMVVCLQEEVEQLNSELQQLQAVHGQEITILDHFHRD
ncbi:hypothetical protein Q8A73_005792 [Channa argus]|nr:hypothetical protein Q8A73_005792 [Channa argus]